ncbi:Kinesin-like protein KIF20B [Orchesella cincta]|uniref:Kinesin-like protein KIF20B n=1 Tax=Orchesella cincta TaxID=48709 RepID=A0A1D2N7M3_ORCCI|nr:Kinesin-like protein KIF20B [Orchesella cincta]
MEVDGIRSSSDNPSGSKSGVSPGQRPSYVDFSSTSGLYPSLQPFDERVIKRLDSELFNETASTEEHSVADATAEDEKLKTFLRIRPVSVQIDNARQVIAVQDCQTIVAFSNPKNTHTFQHDRSRKQTEFKFTKVLGPECGQSTVFEECVTPVIEKFLKNENCLIFSYGATNSGKTYTMQGHGTEYGIIPRTLDAIFTRINDRQYKVGNIRPHLYEAFLHLNPSEVDLLYEKRDRVITEASIKQELMHSYRLSTSGFSDKSGMTVDIIGGGGHTFDLCNLHSDSTLYSVWVSYAELYNERVYDLLDNTTFSKSKRRKELKLMQDRNGFVYVKDLTEFPVTSDEEAYKLFLAGRKNLQFAATQMNMHSSRSHSFFTIRVVSLGIGDGLVPYPKTVHRLTFCDLAGMERANQTENEGFRLKESGTINNSLTVLLKVIRLLREKQLHGKHGVGMIETIPFRDSKLTHIFKSYLTSSTHVCMVVNVNPDPFVAESTLQVLQNSAIASNVIVYRPIDMAVPQHVPDFGPQGKVIGKPPLPPGSVRRRDSDDSSAQTSSRFSTASEADEYEMTTVVAPKTLAQKLAMLEMENARLRDQLAHSEMEKQKIREDMLKMIVEERILWSNRLQQRMLTEENLNRRRLSLMKHEVMLSPASRCGRCSPPTADMEDIDETFEEENEDSNEDDSDKEN